MSHEPRGWCWERSWLSFIKFRALGVPLLNAKQRVTARCGDESRRSDDSATCPLISDSYLARQGRLRVPPLCSVRTVAPRPGSGDTLSTIDARVMGHLSKRRSPIMCASFGKTEARDKSFCVLVYWSVVELTEARAGRATPPG